MNISEDEQTSECIVFICGWKHILTWTFPETNMKVIQSQSLSLKPVFYCMCACRLYTSYFGTSLTNSQ